MTRKHLRLLTLAAVLTLSARSVPAQEPGNSASGTAGVLLLRNGQVVEGRIQRQGEYFEVTRPDEELRLRAADVEMVCHDLDEGYRRKQAAVQPGNLQDRLQLAQWCLRHDLLSAASEQLGAAAQIDPGHPMIGVLQRRLKMAVERPREAPPPPRPLIVGPTNEELDRMTRGMPPGTVETFVQVIQPVLLNHCTTSGCHGQQSAGGLQFMRPPIGQPPTRRITQRNLHEVLQWIDGDHPGESRLLSVPRAAHGTAKAPVFTDRQSLQYRRLAEWVYRVAQKPVPTDVAETFPGLQPATAASPLDSLSQPHVPKRPPYLRAAPRSAAGEAGPIRPASATAPVDGPPRPSAAGAKPARSPRSPRSAESRRTTGGDPAAPGETGGDPFDPEAFNRQLAPQDTPPGKLPTPAARALQGE